jgi:hypothetical protein
MAYLATCVEGECPLTSNKGSGFRVQLERVQGSGTTGRLVMKFPLSPLNPEP